MPELTLSMIVKNEEKYLRECLESVKDIADEIVIVDTGSTDRTIEIAKEFNAQIFEFEWIDDFAAARNHALSKSNGKWILYMDADERLLPESIPHLQKIISGNKKFGARCLIDCPDTYNNKPSAIMYPRLFPNDKRNRFTGSVHEQILESLQKNGYKIKDTQIKILHVGYDVPQEEMVIKANRNLKLLEKEFQKTKSIYSAFQLAQTYGVLEDVENVKKYFGYIIKTPKSPPIYKANAFRYLAAKEFEANNIGESLNLAKKAESFGGGNHPILYSLLSKLYTVMGDLERAQTYIDKAFNTNKSETKSDFILTAEPMALLFQALQVSTLAQNKEKFNFYLNELKKIDKSVTEQNKLMDLVEKLFNHIEIEPNKCEQYSDLFNIENSRLLFTLIDKYPFPKTKIALLENMKGDVCNTSAFLNSCGHSLLELGDERGAKIYFEKSLDIEIVDPSIIFFLISVYVSTDEIEKINKLLVKADEKFGNIPEINEKLEILKSKLSSIL